MFLRQLLLCGLILACGFAIWRWTTPIPSSAHVTHLEPGHFHSVDVLGEQSEFDLDFDANESYVLIVSSLGNAANDFQVELKTKPSPRSRLLPARKIASHDIGEQRPTAKPRLVPISSPHEINADQSEPHPRQRDFFIHVTDGPLDHPAHYARVQTHVVAEGKTVRVYLDRNMSKRNLARGLLREITRYFDDELIPQTRQTIGICRDIDHDGKLAVVLTPWLGRLQGGKSSLGGMVRGSDFRPHLQFPFSNRGDIIYLNTNLQPDDHLEALLAHEFIHAIAYSERTKIDTLFTCPREEDWLNEAMAHIAENLYSDGWSNLDYRISRYLDDTASYPLVVSDYYGSGLWRNHGCRGATYLFLRWIVDQYGEETLGRLIRNNVAGCQNIENVTGCDFPQLFRQWTIALWNTTRQIEGESPISGRNAAFHSISLNRPLKKWGLIGPRPVNWSPTEDLNLHLKGTSTRFVRILNSKDGRRRVSINAEPGTQLQLTLMKEEDFRASHSGEARWLSQESITQDLQLCAVSNESTSPNSAIIVRFFEQSASKSHASSIVNFLTCEYNVGKVRQTHCFRADDLAEFRIPNSNQTISDEGYRLIDTYLIPRHRLPPYEELTFKAQLINAHGRTTSLWMRPQKSTGQFTHRTMTAVTF